MRKWSGTKYLTVMGIFSAIIFLMAFTPIGYIQLPFIKATVIHIPVILGAIVLGWRYGAVLGFLFGVTSFISNTTAPVASSFVFSPLIPVPGTGHGNLMALAVCFIPRILVGIIPPLVYTGLQKITAKKYKAACLSLSGIAGAFTNTLLVMHMIFFFFKDDYASVKNVTAEAVYSIILGVIASNGVSEAIAAAILIPALVLGLNRLERNNGGL